jgi:hypothetical protein
MELNSGLRNPKVRVADSSTIVGSFKQQRTAKSGRHMYMYTLSDAI